MHTKGKIFILLVSILVFIYALAGLFYGRAVAENDGYKEIKVFVDVLKRVNDDYVEKPDLSKVMEGAMRGLIEALDPYGSYLPKEKLEAIERQKEITKADIGIELSKRGGLVYVLAPILNGPAHRAGVRSDDIIDSIDDKPTAELSLVEVHSLLRGRENTEVKLALIRASSPDPIEKRVKREILRYPEITTQNLSGNIGYIKVPFLYEGVFQIFSAKLNTLTKNGTSKIILDLRNTAGGEFNEALAIANAFLKDGVIVFAKGHDGNRIAYEAKPDKAIWDSPVAVLVNQSTAGPAEIIAAALLDHKRAQLIGEKTFGMGSKQKLMTLKNGAALIVSTEKYLTPSGKNIQEESARFSGIKPSVISPEEKYKSDLLIKNFLDETTGADEKYKQLLEKIEAQQLDKAVEVLSKDAKIAKKAA